MLSILFALIVGNVYAQDQWLCSTQASERRRYDILSCGIGQGSTEQEAREDAFRSAKAEFNAICQESYDCVGHAVKVSPKRTACNPDKDGYKCYRLVVFTLDDTEGVIASNPPPPSAVGNDFKLKEGMSKSALIAGMGSPSSIGGGMYYNDQGNYQESMTLFYRGQWCSDENMCSVLVSMNKVVSWEGINPKFDGRI